MEYQISEKIRRSLAQLLLQPFVQETLKSIKASNEDSVEEQIEFTKTEAPTFHEEGRSRLLCAKLKALGLDNAQTDDNKNVIASIKGSRLDERVLLEAHMDTVYSFGTVKTVRREGNMIYAPGILDNARGIANLLTVVRALQKTDVKTIRPLLIAGTTREEAAGGLGGMRDLFQHYPDIRASVSIDGGFFEKLTFNATFNKACEYIFRGPGGHAFNAFGLAANPIGAASRTVVKLQGLSVPETPRTTYAASKIISAEDSGITAIPENCRLYINFRSDGAEEFKALEESIEACIQAGVQEENERWHAAQITVEKKELLSLPGGRQSAHLPLVEAAMLCGTYVGAATELRYSGNSNSNIPISKGIPAVTVGGSRTNYHSHSASNEYFCTEEAYRLPQGVFLLMLMLLGVEGVIEPLELGGE